MLSRCSYHSRRFVAYKQPLGRLASSTPNCVPEIFRSWFSAKTTGKEEKDEDASNGALPSENVGTQQKNETPTYKKRDELQRIRDELPVTFADISRAQVAIRDGVVRTKCEISYFLSELIGANIYIKPEFRQFTGSFKERGARNAILQLKRALGSELKGVIAASAGNHALALAYHGRLLDVPVCVVMPTVARKLVVFVLDSIGMQKESIAF